MPGAGDLGSFLRRMPAASRAAAWAEAAHAGQLREVDGAPFVVHPYEVAMLLHTGGYGDEVLAVALLHDVIEKGGSTVDEIRAAFGSQIAADVAVLSEDAAIADPDERKAALRRSVEASREDVLPVFAADKIVKARELCSGAAAGRLSAREAAGRHAHYAASLELLERRLPGHPLTDALRFELAAQLEIPALSRLLTAPTAAHVAS